MNLKHLSPPQLLCILVFGCLSFWLKGQHHNEIIATLDTKSHVLHIEQKLLLKNTSSQEWDHIILLDWAHAFSNKNTPLALRLSEDFKNRFEFAKPDERGATLFTHQEKDSTVTYHLERVPEHPDVVRLNLTTPIQSGEEQSIQLHYQVKIPKNNFTGYGRTPKGDYHLKHWYLSPAPFIEGEWIYFSHKGLNDFFPALMSHKLSVHTPTTHTTLANATLALATQQTQRNSSLFTASDKGVISLHITQKSNYRTYGTPAATIITDLTDDDVPESLKALFIDRIGSFLKEELGPLKNEELLISKKYYKEDPVYGLSSLPSFLNPFPAGFTYELQLLKSMTRKWIEQGPRTHPRKDSWWQQGMVIHLLIKYHQQYYPDLKIAGKLGDIWGIKGFNITQLHFTDQYNILYENSSRLNIDQAAITPIDELVKYNLEVANARKIAAGFQLLEAYLDSNEVQTTNKSFYKEYQNKYVTTSTYERLLNGIATKDVKWFFNDYLVDHKRIDWKIKRLKKHHNRIDIHLKNKSGRNIPLPLYELDKDSTTALHWIPPFKTDTLVSIPKPETSSHKRIAINHDHIIPEFSRRDNYKSVSSTRLNRPIEIRLFKDIEDPERSQVYLMPDFGFNVYDGFTAGVRLNNGTVLPKPFRYTFKPIYGTNSNQLIGSMGMAYTHYFEDRSEQLNFVRYGASGNMFSYADDLMYRRATAWFSLGFRPADLRSNKKSFFTLRNVLVSRDRDPSNPVNKPDYNVFAINFGMSDPNFKRFLSYNAGVEISPRFGKFAFRAQWRKLFRDSRQLNIRFYTGHFLYNDTQQDGDFFSFALDRPTDYLFDYDYYGRSDDVGLFSQQLIIAEGGFKSQLNTPFANQWISTINTSYSIWKYVFAYADVGLVKNQGTALQGVYDSGIRLNLLQDYFELYFPIYSSNGWEVGQEDYDQRIRFIVTLDLRTLTGLFTRRWY